MLTQSSPSYVGLTVAASASITFNAASTSSVLIAADNPLRRGLIVHNDASGSMYLKYGMGAANSTGSTGGYTFLIPGRLGNNDAAADKAARSWFMPYPIYTGPVTVSWEGTFTAGDHCHVTELT